MLASGMRSILVLYLCTVAHVIAVDRLKFKACEQSGFCRRQRAVNSPTGYEVVKGTAKFNDTAFSAEIKAEGITLNLYLVALQDSTFRIVIDEPGNAIRERYRPLDALKERDPKQQKLKKVKTDNATSKLVTEDGHRVVITHDPFRIDFYSQEVLVTSINSAGLLMVEPFKKKVLLSDRENGYWEETFKDHKDAKPYAFSFQLHVYWLIFSRNYEPYRLYNLDVFEYDLNSPMALYGSIPYMVGVSDKRTTGVLWLNSAETWVDIEHTSADKVDNVFICFIIT
ncbi:hypothetical protein NECAME_16707 [Necator americanus]|uniref:Glycoside hydrolase family 31 N-terminal domain-containing protein n=1 Tax=Necator americanus TaxID=51031 RepID=W2TUZ7_NECAM|nr:hypothetical protein NECAME_16707 [Necator americanus]ETN85648.1 hypothetical protein NECAME_16707 [Necator americanus]